MPLVSVVSGYHNRKPLLERTIRSVLDQTLTDLEFVVFDDASTDGSAEQLHLLSDQVQDARLRPVIHAKNVGFTRGLIEAINQTDSEFIAIQGSGDVSHPERINRQVALLRATPTLGAVGCWYRNIDEVSGAVTVKKVAGQAAQAGSFSHGEVVFRRSAYERAGGYRPQFRSAQLTDLRYRIAEFASFGVVPEVLYDRYLLADGLTLNPTKTIEQARFLELANQLRILPPAEQSALLGRVDAEGIDSVVSVTNPFVQARLVKVIRAMCMHGRAAEAKGLLRQIADPAQRRAAEALVGVTALPAGSSALRAAVAVRRRLRRAIHR